MLVQAILIGLIAAFGKLDYQLGTLYAFRPIVLCPLVGIVLGDLQSGLAIGASLELLFMGSISIGAYVPPDEVYWRCARLRLRYSAGSEHRGRYRARDAHRHSVPGH